MASTIFSFIGAFLNIYMLCFFVWALLSWIPQFAPSLMQNPILSGLQSFLDTIILPWVRLFSFVKPMRFGNVMMDMSSLVAFLVLIIVTNYVFPAIKSSVAGVVLLPAAIPMPVQRISRTPRPERSTS